MASNDGCTIVDAVVWALIYLKRSSHLRLKSETGLLEMRAAPSSFGNRSE
jgi:hypothetical protein